MPVALLSCYDKGGVPEFARQLYEWNWDIFASGGTAKAIAAAGVQVHDVSELVGGEAILDHRVVTLSREVHAGLLAKRTKEDVDEIHKLNIPFINLVYVSLYPLVEELQKPEATLYDVTEKTDIGGPTMLRAGAKGRRLVVTNAEDAQELLKTLEEKDGSPVVDDVLLRRLAFKAEHLCSSYALASAAALCTDTNMRTTICKAYKDLTGQELCIRAKV